MKRKKLFVVVAMGVALFCGFFTGNDAEAYWKESKDGTKQCFAIQYSKQEPHNNPVEGVVDGKTKVKVKYEAYSTIQVCAPVKDDKVTGKLYTKDNPKDTKLMSHPKLTVGTNYVYLKSCPAGGWLCTATKEQSETFKVEDYATFKELADAVTKAAQKNYNNNKDAKKLSLDDETTRAKEKEKAKKTEGTESVESLSDEGDEKTEQCYAESGKLGWILCPIVKGASEAGEFLWDRVQEMLNVPAQEIFVGDETNDSGVEVAWSAIRDIANVMFVVLFLIVIFSQLTGVGIDNYGIKKILPKLIVAAILINLSYVICELAVDVSNILGNGLEGLLSDPAKDIEYNVTDIAAAGLVTTALTGGGAILYTLLGAGAATGGLGIIALGLAVFGVVISIVVAIIFVYLILVIRQAGIVLLVVLSPAAIACYMLPNTEKLFKRWLDLFKALLLVYPICGALVGAGQLGGAILASTGSTEMIVAGMIVTVAPFFLIPILLKSSLALLGNLGAKLQNTTGRIGQGFSNAGSSAIKNTEGVRNAMKLAGEERAARWAQRTVNRLGGRSNLSGRNQHRLLDAQKALNARMLSNAEAEVGAYALDENIARSRATSAREAQELRAYQDQFAGFDRDALLREAGLVDANGVRNNQGAVGWINTDGADQRMSALLSTMASRGMESDMYQVLRNNAIGSSGRMTTTMQTLAGSDNKVLKAYGKTGNGVDYNDFMAGTMYRDGNGNITNQATDANGRANTSVSMQRYAEQKGGEFVNGLDDKALAEISRVDNGGRGPEIMSTGQLTQAAANLNDEASMDSINAMLGSRQDIHNAISADQLTKFNVSTLNDLEARAHNDVALKNAILQASNTIASDPKMAGSMSAANKTIVNNIRGTRNLPPIP